MENTQRNEKVRIGMPKLPAMERVKTFDEVELGFSEELALAEARRCFGCEVGLCVGCKVCAEVCPNFVIHIEQGVNREGRVYSKDYQMEIAHCLFCGLCQEYCPTKCLKLTGDYELSTRVKEEITYSMDRLRIASKNGRKEENEEKKEEKKSA